MPSAAYLKIYNGATNAISLYKGANSTALLTSTGGKLINSGESMVFEVQMTDLGNQTYSEFVNINQYRIGNAVNSGVYITTGTEQSGEGFDFYAGKMYTVNVGGDDLTYTVDTKWMDSSADVQF